MILLNYRPALSTLLCSFTLLLCTSGLAQNATPLTLSEVQDQAGNVAINVLQFKQELTAASLELSAFQASLKPRLELVANLPNYYRTSREVVLDDGTIGFREIELNNSFVGLFAGQQFAATNTSVTLESRLQRTDNLVTDDKSYQGSPVRLTVRQPLLAFNPLKWDRELLPLRQQVAERDLVAARAAARLEATDRFFDLVTADQERRIAELNQTANEQLFAVAEERFALGKINRGDLVQLRLELTSARQDLLRAARQVTSASAAIDRLLGRAEGSGNYAPILPTADQPADIDESAARAHLQRNRPELLAALVAEREPYISRSNVSQQKIYSLPNPTPCRCSSPCLVLPIRTTLPTTSHRSSRTRLSLPSLPPLPKFDCPAATTKPGRGSSSRQRLLR